MLIDDIRGGETDQLEFKEVPNRDSAKWLKTVVAFANGRGGRIVFGVAQAFAYMNIIEDWGSGIPRIRGDIHDAGLRDLEIDPWPNAVRTVIYRHESPKTDIESPKTDIDDLKTDIEGQASNIERHLSVLTGKMRKYVKGMLSNGSNLPYFKRSDVMTWTGLSHTAASELLEKLSTLSVVVPVSGCGKGAYRFN